jgi:hypothetical protein
MVVAGWKIASPRVDRTSAVAFTIASDGGETCAAAG